MQNVVDTAFGASAAKIDQWARTQAQSFGLSELQAKQFSGYFGSMLQTSGIDQATSAEMAMRLSERAGDLASFFNIGIEDAYRKIMSGMSGEREPLLRYGLDLGADSVGEYAGMKLKDMTNDERYQARYDYLMDKSGFLSGDFERTSDELANSGRSLENNWNRFLGSLGEKALPLLRSGANAANDLFDALYDESAEKSLAGIDAGATDAITSIGQAADTARAAVGALDAYGEKAALSTEQQKSWETVAGELVRTIPEMGGLIDMQTGEIEGGTAALEENIRAWEESSKAAAKTSALEAKKALLSDISDEIAREQGLLALAEKQLEQSGSDVVSLGAAIAKSIGEDFGGTVEDTRKLLSTDAGFFAAMDYPGADEMLAGYTAAEEAIASHKESIDALQSDYATVQASIETGSSSMSDAVGSASTSITSALGDVEAQMSSVVDGFDQSETAYTNAYRTGMSAAGGLTDAYGAYQAAASLYSGGLGGGLPQLRSTVKGYATGLDYVPYDEFPAILHEGEAVLTKTEAQSWRGGGENANAQAIATAVAQAVEPLYRAISNIQIVMDRRIVGNAVTQTVSENIAREARNLRYAFR